MSGQAQDLGSCRAIGLYSDPMGVLEQSHALWLLWHVANVWQNPQSTRLLLPLFQATQICSRSLVILLDGDKLLFVMIP